MVLLSNITFMVTNIKQRFSNIHFAEPLNVCHLLFSIYLFAYYFTLFHSIDIVVLVMIKEYQPTRNGYGINTVVFTSPSDEPSDNQTDKTHQYKYLNPHNVLNDYSSFSSDSR